MDDVTLQKLISSMPQDILAKLINEAMTAALQNSDSILKQACAAALKQAFTQIATDMLKTQMQTQVEQMVAAALATIVK